VSIVRRSNDEIRRGGGRVDPSRLRAASDADIQRWKQEDGDDDSALGPPRFVPRAPDVRALRERLGLSQQAFAQRFHLALRTVQEWEQGRRIPEGPARTLLLVIDRDPEGVERALAVSTASS
jgi:putative transcriptional regulator